MSVFYSRLGYEYQSENKRDFSRFTKRIRYNVFFHKICHAQALLCSLS